MGDTKRYVEEQIKAAAEMMSRHRNRLIPVRPQERDEFRKIVLDAAKICGVSDVDGWLRDMGVVGLA